MSATGAMESASAESGIVPAGSGAVRGAYLARQPILNRRGGVLGYELRYHDAAGAPCSADPNAGHGLIDTLALFGAERFAGGQWVFIRCTSAMLLEEPFEALSPSLMVLEFPSSAEPSPKRLRACNRLLGAGFRLALTGFDPRADRDPLLDLVEYIKVDEGVLGTPVWESFSKGPFPQALTVIAENVQTHESYVRARGAGIEYFQGLYFCMPDLIANGTIPANHVQHVEILRHLFKDPLDLKSLCPLVECDASLVYRVLRFVNSPLCALRQTVTSVESAIILLGDATFRRIATLAIQCGLKQDHSPELLNMALVRAHFCAAAATLCGFNPEEQYLLGMLSLLPPMLGVPMELILPGLPLRDPIRDALAGLAVRERCLLGWIEELEQDRIAELEAITARWGLEKDRLVGAYVHALEAVRSVAAVAQNGRSVRRRGTGAGG
jgi:EAL and modified HD-GYP domain-containing signal transduction protein